MDYQTKQLDHLGLVAGICERLELVEQIDSFFPNQQRKVSVGLAVKAMVLNALGFSSRPLYLSSEFFEKKSIEQLFGDTFQADDFNDDSLGRALDALFQADVTTVFSKVASHAFGLLDLPKQFVHLDTSSFSFQGEYKEQPQSHPEEPIPIHITYGYSKDEKPKLKQLVCSMICAYKTSIPLWMETLSGNSSDKTSFSASIKKYVQHLEGEKDKKTPCFIMDSAFYSEASIQQAERDGIFWLTRVPETIKEARVLLETLTEETFQSTSLEGYSICEKESEYAGIKQRWMVVSSEKAREREEKTFASRQKKEQEEAEKELKQFSKQEFDCQKDGQKALEQMAKKWKYHHLGEISFEPKEHYEKKGRPKKGEQPSKVTWKLSSKVEKDEEAIEKEKKKLGRFILSTTLAKGEFSSEEALESYKAQGSSIEKGFRFLKDPMFFASGMYLHKPSRVMALTMVMCLSLLVYSFAEHLLRKGLKENNDFLPDQKGKPTQKLTIRRMFQMFEGISLLLVSKEEICQKLVLNMNDLHHQIISYLGEEVRKCYLSK